MGAYTSTGALRTSASAQDAVAIVTSDTVEQHYTDVYVGVSGDVEVVTAFNWNQHAVAGKALVPVVFKAAPVGRLGVAVAKVMATGTTATNLVGLTV